MAKLLKENTYATPPARKQYTVFLIIYLVRVKGYKDWSNAHQGLDSHKRSSEHIERCKHFSARSKITGRVDTEL